jgi:hyperosmotically inducible protein
MKKLKVSILLISLLAVPLVSANTSHVNDNVYRNKTQAERDAKCVENKVETVVSDTVITAKVKELFLEDKDISSLILHVTTKKGVVHLKGKVNTAYEKKIAINLAKTVKGVKDVKCDLKVLNA